MKLLYFYVTHGREGSYIHIKSFVDAFARLGDEIVDAGLVVAPFAEDKSTWSVFRKLRAKLEWILWNVGTLLAIGWHCVRQRPEVILIRFLQDHRLFLPIALLSKFYPLILEINTLRSNENPAGATALIKRLDRWSLKSVDRSFVVSALLRAQLIERFGLIPEQVAVIENGVDMERFESVLDGEKLKQELGLTSCFVIGFVGSFKPWHGLQHLLTLAKATADDARPLRFLIVGEGEERRAFERFAADAGLQERVIFTGHVEHDQVPRYLQVMDIAMAPYSADIFADGGGFHGSPLKIFEYMAAGKAIVAAPVGQLKELIVDGESGRLIASEDTARLRTAIQQLCDDATQRRRLGENARKRVAERYTWSNNARKVRALCLDALTAQQSPNA